VSVYLNGVDITATAGALVIHDTDIKADLGDYSGQENLNTLLAALGIPDVSAKSFYTCLVTDRLDHATYGLSALHTDIGAIPTTMVGTDDAAKAATLEDAMQKATDPAYSQDTDSQEAISEAVAAIPTVMVGTNDAATATDLATAQADLDHINDSLNHLTKIFPAATNLDCVLTANATANVWSAYTEIADTTGGTPITLSSLFAATAGHITGMITESANTDDTTYMVEISYGSSHQRVSVWRLVSATNKVSSTGQSSARGCEIPAGETIYYRCMCETASSKTLNVHFRYYLHS